MKKFQGTVSVILPIYNAEKYLSECITSILNQTYSDLQIILVDDGSVDNSLKVCKSFQKKDDRILYLSQKNSGVSVARNKGLSIATGKWIMFVDPDDKLKPTIIERLLSKVDSKTDIVACSCYGFNDQSYSQMEAHFFKGERVFDVNKTDLYLQLLNINYGQYSKVFTAIGVPWGKIYRKSFIEKYQLSFDPNLRRMQDNIFNMYAFYYARKIYYLDQALYYYRLDNINSFNDKNLTKLKDIFLPVIKARYKELNKLGLINNSQIYSAYINETANLFLEIVRGILLTKQDVNNIKDIMKLPCVDIIFSDEGKKEIRKYKIRFKLSLIKRSMFKTYVMIYKFHNFLRKKY